MGTTKSKTTLNFAIECKGLKPNTIHQFFYESIDNTSLCLSDMPAEKNTTVLKTDSSGNINFRFALSVDQTKKRGWYDWRRWSFFTLDIAGNKKFELRATNSSAIKTVLFSDT
jgi:hypothetical protein